MGFRIAAAALAVLVTLGCRVTSAAEWPAWITALTDGWTDGTGVRRVATLEQASRLLTSLPAAQTGPALAAEVTAEGHWTFINSAGERFTAASADELKRVVPMLVPEADKPGLRLVLLLTEETVFKHRRHLASLPLAGERRTSLLIAVEGLAYPLSGRGDRPAERIYYAEIRPNLLVELTDRRLFDEVVWQLAHSLKRSSIRVLALEPGGPTAVPSTPRLDAQTRRPLTDAVAPQSLATAVRSLGGQTVIVTARREKEALVFKPSSGPEQTIALAPVLAAAEAGDVNLVLLQSATPRQPGMRSWLWQRVSVSRLDDAMGRDHLADFLNALGSAQSRLIVSASDDGDGRTRLRATPLRDDSRPRTGIGDTLSDLVSDIAGRVVVSGVEASLRDRNRQRELDRRVVPAIPSVVQLTYLVLLMLGTAGHPVARSWWARLWPSETRDNYGNAAGYQLARVARSAAYIGMFMPLAAPASAPAALLRALGRGAGSLGEMLARPLREPGKHGA